MYPITGIAGCCARAATGKAAAPPSSDMNARLFMCGWPPPGSTSKERVLPNTRVEFAMKDGRGCNASHYTPAELQGKIVPDEHLHEHATCFNVKERGLVVISSCGHVGIVNSAR